MDNGGVGRRSSEEGGREKGVREEKGRRVREEGNGVREEEGGVR